jgi:hypothetical protein
MPITDDIASVSVAFGTFFDVPKILFMRPRDYQEHKVTLARQQSKVMKTGHVLTNNLVMQFMLLKSKPLHIKQTSFDF